MTDSSRYPALIIGRLTPVYDLFVRLFLREKAIKDDLVAQARIAPGHRVLDLGAGTGTLTIAIKRVQPSARVRGLDGDPEILTIAREKARRGAPARASTSTSARLLRCRTATPRSTTSCRVWSSLS